MTNNRDEPKTEAPPDSNWPSTREVLDAKSAFEHLWNAIPANGRPQLENRRALIQRMLDALQRLMSNREERMKEMDTIDSIIAGIKSLNDEQRVELFGILESEFCARCGQFSPEDEDHDCPEVDVCEDCGEELPDDEDEPHRCPKRRPGDRPAPTAASGSAKRSR